MPLAANNVDATVKQTLRLMDTGWGQLSSQTRTLHKNRAVSFVLGGTGYGKSTLTQIATGDLSRLHAKQKYRTGFVIVDQVEGGATAQGRIGDPQVASKTFLPECLPCNDDPSIVFVDCPGFDDNRGTHMDIANMILTKKIAQQQKDNVRFLFVVPSSSVSYSNMHRNDFLQLCTHATSFFKNLDKVQDSIGLVITKVNNKHPSTGENIEYQDVISETSQFLEDLMDHDSISVEVGQFIEILLKDKSKWALIRYPDKNGPLSEMGHFVQARQQLREMVTEKLKGAPVTSDDFGITLSPDSRYVIVKKLIPHMKGEIDRAVVEVVSQMDTGFCTKFKAELQGHRGAALVTFVNNLEDICGKVKKMADGDGHADVTPNVTKLREWLHVDLSVAKTAKLEKMEEQLQLFQEVTGESDPERGCSAQITKSFSSLKTKLDDLHKSTLKMVKESHVQNVEAHITAQSQKIVKVFDEKYTTAFWSSMENGNEYGRNALEKLQRDMVKFEELEKDFGGGKMSAALRFIGDDDKLIAADSLKKLEELEEELELLLKLTGQGFPGVLQTCSILADIRKVVQKLRSEAQEKVWDVYIKLVHGKIHKTTNAMFPVLENKFFRDTFYPGMDMKTMPQKRQLLSTVHSKLQQFWANFSGIRDALEKAFKIFALEIPGAEKKALGEYETLLNFYDDFLGKQFPRPVSEWTAGLRSLQERIQEKERLYEFLTLAKATNPMTIEGALKVDGGNVDGTIGAFLNALKATSDIRGIVQGRGCAEDKLLITSIATYLDQERSRLKAEEDRKAAPPSGYPQPVRISPGGQHPGVEFINAVGKLIPPVLNAIAGSMNSPGPKFQVPSGSSLQFGPRSSGPSFGPSATAGSLFGPPDLNFSFGPAGPRPSLGFPGPGFGFGFPGSRPRF